jgi:hypothetical protein
MVVQVLTREVQAPRSAEQRARGIARQPGLAKRGAPIGTRRAQTAARHECRYDVIADAQIRDA